MSHSLTELEIRLKASENPPTAMEIHVNGFLSISEFLDFGFEDPDYDLASFDGAFLVCDFESTLFDESSAISGQICVWVGAEALNGNLMGC